MSESRMMTDGSAWIETSDSDSDSDSESYSKSSSDGQARKRRKGKGGTPWSRGLICLAGFACLALVGVGIIVALLWSKSPLRFRPTWTIQEMTIRSMDVPALGMSGVAPADTSACPITDPCGLTLARGCSVCPEASMHNEGCLCKKVGPGVGLSGIMSGIGGIVGGFLHNQQSSLVKIDMHAVAKMQNPAPVPARAESGTFNISYQGAVIGTAVTEPVDIPPSGDATLEAECLVDHVNNQEGFRMMQEMMSTRMQVSVKVSGSVLATSLKFRVRCLVECDLTIDVSKLPAAKFTRNDCTYMYRPG